MNKVKLNEEGRKIAERFKDAQPMGALIGEVAIEVIATRLEIKRKVDALTEDIKKVLREGDEQLKKMQEEARAKAETSRAVGTELFALIRQVHPELQDAEFTLDLNDMTYEITKSKDTKMEDSIKDMVADLINRVR